MNWLSRHPIAIVALIAVAVVLAVLFVPMPDDNDRPRAAELPVPTYSPRPSAEPREAREATTQRTETVTSTSGATLGAGRLNYLPGLTGEGAALNTPARTVTMTVTSDEDVPVFGYLVPTSRDDYHGQVKNPGRSASITTTAYGPPDYAQMFLQAGARATRITCTITVDGRVTEQRTATGPYSQLFCQG